MRNVLNTLSVFEAIARAQPVALPGVVARVGSPTTTAHRAIGTLAEAGWVTREAGGTRRWMVADRVVRLVTTGEHPLHAAAAPVCAELRDLCGESVVLSIPDDDQMVVIGHWDGTGVLRVVQAVGTRAPMVMLR
ncbi:helix-turn-helix domain-containing protein [Mycobacterium sp.]|uniref:helix-turn-helix domain-containing protein n=1 Tax=Mycobacterium sp. TaxID=1785 RepID=UPI003BA99A97